MTTCEQIAYLYSERKQAQGPVVQMMRDVRDVYNGDVVVPLPEREENEKVAVANLLAQGLDQMADRVASMVPDVKYPPKRHGKSEQDRAADRRRANLGWWEGSLLDLQLYRRGRHLLGYGSTPMLVKPDFTQGFPRFQWRDPLSTFAGAPTSGNLDDPCVDDCIFAITRTHRWLKYRYPDQMSVLALGRDCSDETRFDLLEYVDGYCKVLMVLGRSDDDDPTARSLYSTASTGSGRPWQELERADNKAGVCTATVPGRINLERRKGQFDGMLGMYQAQARLFALEVIAVEQGIFPDEWLIARPNETPDIVQVADGRRGIVGMVRGGELRQQQRNPGQMTYPTIDRLERSQRLNAGIPAEFGGESTTNVRTGRRGENILSATIDFTLLQAHRVLSSSLQAENARAIAVDKGYHDTAKSFYVGWVKAKGEVDYTPSELFVSDENLVSYAQAGTDLQGFVISAGQRVGMETLSKRSFMEKDPLVEDPEEEFDRITAESLQNALRQSILQQAGAGAIPPGDVARIAMLVATDKKELAEAVEQVQREAQERQAALVEAQAPEAQPGLAMPGAGAESTPIAKDPLGASPGNLADLLGQLRRPQALDAPSEAARPEARV